MYLASPSRRALGIVAVGAVGMSTAILGASGVAQAAPPAPIGFTAADGTVTVPSGYCTIDWTIIGGEGGANGTNMDGAPAGKLVLTTDVTEGDVFTLFAGTAGADGDPLGDGAGGTNGDGDVSHSGSPGTAGGGGGGAASTVQLNGSPYLSAFGGDGADAAADTGGDGGGGDLNVWASGPLDPAQGTAITSAPGPCSIAGTIQACIPDAPGTPTLYELRADEASAVVRLWRGYIDPNDTSTVTYEYRLDGGSWQTLPTTGDFELTGTIPGLTNGRTYSVEFHAKSDAGVSDPTDAETVTPHHIVAAPANLKVTPGPSLITITWEPPVGETGITGYEVWALPGANPQSDHGRVACPALDAAARTCTVGVPAGQKYSVYAVASDGNQGDTARVVTGVIEAPAVPTSVPTASGPLTTDQGPVSSVTSGSEVTLTGSGYLPNSTVTLVIYSTPTVSVAGPVTGGLAALVVGAGLLVASRRRSAD